MGMKIELHDIRLGSDIVLFEEDVFRFLGVWAVRFREDDDCGSVSVFEG